MPGCTNFGSQKWSLPFLAEKFSRGCWTSFSQDRPILATNAGLADQLWQTKMVHGTSFGRDWIWCDSTFVIHCFLRTGCVTGPVVASFAVACIAILMYLYLVYSNK